MLPALRARRPGSFFGSSPVGGLGWGVPAALGAKLAAPERLVIAAVGDGSYTFANPLACHHAAAEHGIATLTVIFNNGGYGAVERAARSMYPQGDASRHGWPLAWFRQMPAFQTTGNGANGPKADRKGNGALAKIFNLAFAIRNRIGIRDQKNIGKPAGCCSGGARFKCFFKFIPRFSKI